MKAFLSLRRMSSRFDTALFRQERDYGSKMSKSELIKVTIWTNEMMREYKVIMCF
jgi:hypothetical protein